MWVFERISVVSHMRSLCLHSASVLSQRHETSFHSSWVRADHTNVSVRTLWDNSRLYDEVRITTTQNVFTALGSQSQFYRCLEEPGSNEKYVPYVKNVLSWNQGVQQSTCRDNESCWFSVVESMQHRRSSVSVSKSSTKYLGDLFLILINKNNKDGIFQLGVPCRFKLGLIQSVCSLRHCVTKQNSNSAILT